MAAGKRTVKRLDEIEHAARARLVEAVDVLLRAPLRRLVLRHHIRQVAIDAPRPVIRGVHPRAGDRLVDVHQLLALLEAEEEYRHRTNVERVRAEPHQVIQDTRDLIEHHADVLRALRRRDAEQSLDGEHVGVLVAHHRYVVQPVHVADRLVEGLRLGELLGPAVQQTDVRIGFLDDLAVHLQHQAQHAVSSRVLRPEVHRVVADLAHRRHRVRGHQRGASGSLSAAS